MTDPTCDNEVSELGTGYFIVYPEVVLGFLKYLQSTAGRYYDKDCYFFLFKFL